MRQRNFQKFTLLLPLFVVTVLLGANGSGTFQFQGDAKPEADPVDPVSTFNFSETAPKVEPTPEPKAKPAQPVLVEIKMPSMDEVEDNYQKLRKELKPNQAGPAASAIAAALRQVEAPAPVEEYPSEKIGDNFSHATNPLNLIAQGITADAGQGNDSTTEPSTESKADATAEVPQVMEPPKGLPAKLPEEVVALQKRVLATLALYDMEQYPFLTTNKNTPDQILDACLPFGCSTYVRDDSDKRNVQKISAFAVICYNFPCKGMYLLNETDGKTAARIGYGRQRTPGQMLATLALAHVPLSYAVKATEEAEQTVKDFVEGEKLDCYSGVNQTNHLIGLSHYLQDDLNQTWKNRAGEKCSLLQIFTEELNKPYDMQNSEGPQRLLALAYALDKRRQADLPLDGKYAVGERFLRKCEDYTFRQQNEDGSWGAYLAGKGASKSPLPNVCSTGYVLEWLTTSLPEGELLDPRVLSAVKFITAHLGTSKRGVNLTEINRSESLAGIMHALRALKIYEKRLLRHYPLPEPPAEPTKEARKSKHSSSRH